MSGGLFDGRDRLKHGQNLSDFETSSGRDIGAQLVVKLELMNILKEASYFVYKGEDYLSPDQALHKIGQILTSIYDQELIEQVISGVRALRDAEIKGRAYSIDILEDTFGWLCTKYPAQEVSFLSGVVHFMYDLKQVEDYQGEEIGLAPEVDPSYCDNLLLLDEDGLLQLLSDEKGFFSQYFSNRSMARQPLIEAKIQEEEQP